MQIAFVCDNLRNDWLEIAEKKLDKLGYNVSHCYSRDGDDFIQSLISGRYDAVFTLSNRYKAVQLNRIAEAGIPVVLYKTREYSHLEPNIVAVAPQPVQRRGKDCQLSGVPRHRAFCLCRRCATICISPAATVSAATAMRWKSTASPMMSAMSAPMRTRWRAVLSHVFDMVFSKSKDERATAIIAGNDFIAASIMQDVKKLGMKIP